MNPYNLLQKNTILNVVRKILEIAIPLVTVSYVIRVLSVDGYGQVNYCASIISYFTIAGMLGIDSYAVREGGRMRDNQAELNRFANDMFSFNMLSVLCSYIVLALLLIFGNFGQSMMLILVIQSSCILAASTWMEWLYIIYEDYSHLTRHTLIAYLLVLVLILIFVKDEDDYIIYAAIECLLAVYNGVQGLIFSRKYIRLQLVKVEIRRYFRPIMILFACTALKTIYINSDITMLGIMAGNQDVAYYGVACKFYNAVRMVIDAAILAAVSRMAYYVGKKDRKNYTRLMSYLVENLITLVFPAVTGLLMTGENLVLILGSEKYLPSVSGLRILSVALIFATFATLLINVILVNFKRDGRILQVMLISAAVNIALNLYCIPRYGIIGASVTTLIPEILVCSIALSYSRDVFHIQLKAGKILSVALGCALIVLSCLLVGSLHMGLIADTGLKVAVSAIAYFGIQIIYYRINKADFKEAWGRFEEE